MHAIGLLHHRQGQGRCIQLGIPAVWYRLVVTTMLNQAGEVTLLQLFDAVINAWVGVRPFVLECHCPLLITSCLLHSAICPKKQSQCLLLPPKPKRVRAILSSDVPKPLPPLHLARFRTVAAAAKLHKRANSDQPFNPIRAQTHDHIERCL